MAAFSLLGKRASFVTQGPGTIIRCFFCPSCSHRNGLTFDWGFLVLFFLWVFFLTTWQVLQPIFVSFLFGKLFGPKPWGIVKNGKWLLSFKEQMPERFPLVSVYVQIYISIYTVHILIWYFIHKNVHLVYIWASCGCPGGSSLCVKR